MLKKNLIEGNLTLPVKKKKPLTKDKPIVDIQTKTDVLNQLETMYRKWITDNKVGNPKVLSVLGKTYTFLSPNELYQFIKGLRLFMEA